MSPPNTQQGCRIASNQANIRTAQKGQAMNCSQTRKCHDRRRKRYSRFALHGTFPSWSITSSTTTPTLSRGRPSLTPRFPPVNILLTPSSTRPAADASQARLPSPPPFPPTLSAWLMKTPRAPSRHCRDARVHAPRDYGHARYDFPPPPPSQPPSLTLLKPVADLPKPRALR